MLQYPAHLHWYYRNVTISDENSCECDCDIAACLREGKAPVKKPGGIVSQHKCGRDVDRLLQWSQVIPLA